MDLETGKVEITSQNHGFAVDEATLPPELVVTHRNLNDGTIEGEPVHVKFPKAGKPLSHNKDFMELKSSPKLDIYSTPFSNGVQYLGMNVKNTPFDNPKVRQAVAYAVPYQKIIDAATLTGACMVALGHDVAGLFTNDQAWCDQIATAARAVGEPVWQLPMYPEFDEQIRGEVADIKNVGDGRWGGAITAAKFLERFVGGIPWTHVDIAGPAFAEKPRPWIDGGGTGVLVRTLVELARNPSL
jgi:hypothetical protein